MTQVTKSDYRKAQQGNARVRQEFLDAVDFQDVRPYISKVEYSLFPSERNSDDCAATLSPNYSKPLSRIIVYPVFFDTYPFDLFLSILVDHEGFHAKQNTQNRSLREKFSLGCLSGKDKARLEKGTRELGAINNQFSNSKKRNLSFPSLKILEEYSLAEYEKIKDLKKAAALPLKRNLCGIKISEPLERLLGED